MVGLHASSYAGRQADIVKLAAHVRLITAKAQFDSECRYGKDENMNVYYEFHPVAVDVRVKGGLSMTNGNCLMVVRLGDVFEITDSKLGDYSPVWHLSVSQFRVFGRFLSEDMSWVGNPAEYDLGGGCVYTQTPSGKRIGDRPGGNLFECVLTGFESMRFTFDELAAFAWGYHYGQFPLGEPARALVFTV